MPGWLVSTVGLPRRARRAYVLVKKSYVIAIYRPGSGGYKGGVAVRHRLRAGSGRTLSGGDRRVWARSARRGRKMRGAKSGGVGFTFCVDDVRHETPTYDFGDNVETCDAN